MNSVKVLLEVMSLPEQAQAINNIIIHHNAGVAIQDQDIKVLGGWGGGGGRQSIYMLNYARLSKLASEKFMLTSGCPHRFCPKQLILNT